MPVVKTFKVEPHSLCGAGFSGLRIGLLAGSFNPAHAGHLAMSLYALKRLQLDYVWWMVSPQNPLKSTAGMAPLNERLAGARAMAKHPKIAATAIETQIGTRYSIDTLRVLHERFPAVRFIWLMGADIVMQMPRWRRWPEFFGNVPVAVFRRSGYAVTGKAAIRFARARLPTKSAKHLAIMPPPAWLVLDNPLNLLSATAIRRQRDVIPLP